MEAQQLQLDTISNNLANVSTNGYKRSHAVFEDLMYQNLRQAGAASSEQTSLPTGLQVGLGTRAVATARNLSQGNLQQSSNTLDVAIRGNGLFEIQLPDGTTGYTRDGSFQVSSTGQLVTNNGYTVQPGITIPATAQSVTIGNDGTVSVVLPGQALPSTRRPAAARRLRQSGRPRAQGPEHLRRDRGLGHAQRRHAGAERPGLRAAGLRRDLERQRRRGAGADDPDAARLRAQLEGDPDLRPDAAEARPAMSSQEKMRRVAGAVALAVIAAAVLVALSGCEHLNPRPPVDIATPIYVAPPVVPVATVEQRLDLPGGAVPAAVRGLSGAPGRRFAHRADRREGLGDAEEHQLDRQERQARGLGHGAARRLAERVQPRQRRRLHHASARPAPAPPRTATTSPARSPRVVTGVLPNGHLLIAGEKQIGVNHNVDVLRFSGQVDPRMIQTGNVVASAQIANVRVEQRGRGAQAEAQGIGWLSRFFINVLPI